jgi:glycosyltransferase involved in cell wall biosynthesis
VKPPRVALFADCYHEVNGVANTMRHLERYAIENQLPLFMVRSGTATRIVRAGTVTALELHRSPLRFQVDKDLEFDLLLDRHLPQIRRELDRFGPGLIHITGPGDIGIAGVLTSRLMRLPLVASWHTNVHEFGARRLERLFRPLSVSGRTRLCHAAEGAMWRLMTLYYRIPSLLFAPNQELIDALAAATKRTVLPMPRGVDTALFHPAPRDSRPGIVLGYVGRLTPEKNVPLLIEVDRALRDAGVTGARFLVVGDGGERESLAKALPAAAFTGVLRGEALAAAYASMDLLLFPSHTDTFGNVALEAQASGVPVLVTSSGGPKFLVEHGNTGWIAADDGEFVRLSIAACQDPLALRRMGMLARESVINRSWSRVWADLYSAYGSVATASSPSAPPAVLSTV